MTRITILTKRDCPLCEHAKRVTHRLRAEFSLEMEVVDLATSRGQDLASRSGMAFPPGVLVNGEPFGYGRLSERRLRRALQRRLTSGT